MAAAHDIHRGGTFTVRTEVILAIAILACLTLNVWLFVYVPFPLIVKLGIVAVSAMASWLFMIVDKQY